MRSKNLLPVQVAMPSNWMSANQSSHKATFEEALHSSIENSLRSPSVPPSAVFSSLFITYRPTSSNDFPSFSDVKPSIDEVNVESARSTSVSPVKPSHNPSSVPFSYTQRPWNNDCYPGVSEVRGPTTHSASTSNEEVHRCQVPERKNLHADVRPPGPPPQTQFPLLAQHQQLEQIQHARIEQLKQFHKLQAWQQMQKEQQQSRLLLPMSVTRDQHPANHCQTVSVRPSVATVPRSTNPAVTPAHVNGLLRNGTLPPLHSAVSFHRDHNVQFPHHGFCKCGKDIRLSTFESDCSKMLPYPPEYILLALQPMLAKAELLVVVAVNLKSLPPHGTSSQALSAQCLGCGDKSIHTFSQLATHVGIEPVPDPNNSRLNSTQLIGPYARFYLIRDASNPMKLIRGSTAMWYKTNEERMRSLMPVDAATSAPSNPPTSLFRGSMIMVSPSHQENNTPSVPRERLSANLFSSPNYEIPVSRPHLKRALSSPIQKNPVEAGKRQFTSLSQGDVVVINDDPTPKRYVLDQAEPCPKVQIPEEFLTKVERKPVVAFLFPTSHFPVFSGDLSSLLITSRFSECFKPLSLEAKTRLNISDHCSSTVNKVMLLTTVQYLVNLGFNKGFSIEELSSSLLQAQRRLSKEGNFLSEVKSAVVLALCQLAAATSAGTVELIHCKKSFVDGFTECLHNCNSSTNKYQLLIYIEKKSEEEQIHFHLFITGKFCRVVEEGLESREQRSVAIGEDLVSYQFSQLHLSLSDVARKCYFNHPTPKIVSSFDSQCSDLISHKCTSRVKIINLVATTLLTAVEKVFERSPDIDFTDYTSLRFLFLLPPGSSALSETLRFISESNILSELFRASLPVSSLASQVVATMETTSLHRISTLCDQLENSTSLFFLIQLDPHSSRNSVETHSYLNSRAFQRSRNFFTIQCSSFPYSLLTEASRISPTNLVSFKENSFADQQSFRISSIFDPIFEFHKQNLLDKYESLHSSLVLCELLTQHYVTSLALMSSSDPSTVDNNKIDTNQTSSLITNKISRELVCRHTPPSIVIVRIASSILAGRFYDSIKRARKRLGLDEVFELLHYRPNDVSSSLSLSNHFLELLQAYHKLDWFPTSLNDLCGIPCLVVYEGVEVVAELLPKTLKYVDLRMAFTGCLSRFKIEQELSLAAPLCLPKLISNDHPTNNVHQSNTAKQNGVEHVNDKLNDSMSCDEMEQENGRSCKWKSTPDKHVENGYRNKHEEEFSESKQDVLLDFISLAMKEADLPADEKCKGSHVTPLVVLPENVYEIVKNKSSLSLNDLPPHPNCKWKDPLHPSLNEKLSVDEQAAFYRRWITPTNENPDIDNDGHVIDENRLLLVAPPGCPFVEVCCQFLRLLHNKILKALDVMVYDDPEDEIQDVVKFNSLISNNINRGMSQIVNSCTHDEQRSKYLSSGASPIQRNTVTRRFNHALTNIKRISDSNLTNGFARVECIVPLPSDDGSHFRILIPQSQSGFFRFSSNEDGRLDCASLILKRTNEAGIKTPLVSIASHSIAEGLFNITSTGDPITHLLIVKSRDASLFKTNLTNHIIVILPAQYDFLGKGGMKCAAQSLFECFYANERELSSDSDLVWPFFLLKDDDVVTFTKLNHYRDNVSNNSSWEDVSLHDVIREFESLANNSLGAVGFRPWSETLPTSLSHRNAYCNENSFNHSCVESCIFINLHRSSSLKYTATKFYFEDIDWSIRAAAAGLKLFRFENISVVRKVMNPLPYELQLSNLQSPLVTAADSEFDPLCHHPGLLLERYLQQCGSLLFPNSLNLPSRPVLCVDCYLSLGNGICVHFVSTEAGAETWSTEHSGQYGGLIVSSSSNNVNPEFLKEFHFADGAVVCVIGTDRNILRQTVVNLQLESNWHFRLTDEFQTANHVMLGGARTRPFYFLTGVKKNSS